MIKKVKVLSIMLSALALSLGACTKGNGSKVDPSSSDDEGGGTTVHVHTFSDKWTYNKDKHWHESTCGHFVKSDDAPHSYGDWVMTTTPESEVDGQETRTCTVCGYEEHKRVPQVGTPEKLDFILSGDETYYSVKAKNTDIEGRVVIPEIYEGLPVKELYFKQEGKIGAFEECQKIEYVYVPDTITTLSRGTFFSCIGLKSVSLPNTLLTIGGDAFYQCVSLEKITIPNSVTYIDFCAFENCEKLTSIKIPNGVTYIGEEAFSQCISLTSITIPNKVEVINGGLFRYCEKLRRVTISGPVTHIYDFAFYSCSSLEYINLPKTVEYIGDSVFEGCSKLNLNEYEEGLYLGKEDNPYFALLSTDDDTQKSYTINENCKYILENAFGNCYVMESIVIPSNVMFIKNRAFEYCGELKNFTFENGSKLEYLGNEVFSDFYDKFVYNEANNGCYLGSEDNPCLVLKKAKDKTATSFTIDDRCKFICDKTFKYCSSLTSIIIPDSVISIGWNAFEYCSGLKDVTIGKGLETLPSEIFLECSGLTTFVIPEGVKNVSFRAFASCTSLTSVTFPKSIEHIAHYVFDGCSALTDINYVGKKEEWGKVDLPNSGKWGDDVAVTVVHCSDGDISL